MRTNCIIPTVDSTFHTHSLINFLIIHVRIDDNDYAITLLKGNYIEIDRAPINEIYELHP